MRLLLDTHVFIWSYNDPTKLSAGAREAIQDRANLLLLSVASVWEIQIKLSTGKMTLTVPLRQLLTEQQQENQLEILPITLEHIWSQGNLPLHHRDPFDRLIVAQAKAERALLVTADTRLKSYPVKIVW